MNTRLLNYIYVLLFLVSCSTGNGIYQSSYPSYLKNRSTKQISAQSQTKLTSTVETSENSQQSEYKESEIQNPHVIQDSINTYDHPESFESVQTPEASQYLSNSPIENNELNNIIALETYQSDCPTINDLTCQYLGDGVYMLTWSVPKITIYTENGTLSEYRITRRSLEDSKAYVYKTPEPNCIDGTCSIIFKNLDDSFGYTWSVDTRCTRTTFTTSNKVECKRSEPLNSRINETNNNNSLEFKSENDDNAKRTFNKKSVLAFLMVWIMLVAGIIAVITIFIGIPLLTGLLILAIIIGCIWSISTAIQGSKEISNNRKKQKGTALSVLAILGSILGLLLTGLLALVLFSF